MSGTRFNTEWDVHLDAAVSERIPLLRAPGWTRESPTKQPPGHCPCCRSIVYSRRHRLCGVCGEPLPEHLLFADRDARRIELILRSERLRHQRWMAQR